MSYPSNFLNAATNYWCSRPSAYPPLFSPPPPSSNPPLFSYPSYPLPPSSYPPPPSSSCPPPSNSKYPPPPSSTYPPLPSFYPPPSSYPTPPSYLFPPPPSSPIQPQSPSSLSGIINKAGIFWSNWNNWEEEEDEGGGWMKEGGGGRSEEEDRRRVGGRLEDGGEREEGRGEGGRGGDGRENVENKELADFIWGFGGGEGGRSRSESEISFVTNDDSLSQKKVRKAKKKIHKSPGKGAGHKDSALLARKLLAIAKNWGDIRGSLTEETQRIFKEKMQNYLRKRILPEIQQRSLPSSPLPPPPSSLPPPSNDDWIMNEMAPGFFPNEGGELRMPSSPLLPTVLSPVLEMESSGKVLKTFGFEDDEVRE